MQVLVTYDVSTETPEGRRRLRKVAQECLNFGQRVQKSVFECSVSEMQFEKLRSRLLQQIKEEEDSLRIYRLPEPKERFVQTWGVDHYVDFEGPLVS
jgi:CRISPR-associated protein Cas2